MSESIENMIIDVITDMDAPYVTVPIVCNRLSEIHGTAFNESRVRRHMNRLVKCNELSTEIIDGLSDGRKRIYSLVVG